MLKRILSVASAETNLHVKLNGCPVWLPRDTLKTMYHCAHWEADGTLSLLVESGHLTWMIEHLSEGGTFLDVGAATGATTLPIIARFGSSLSIRSYEPAESARALLISTLARNDLRGATIRPVAVSDGSGKIDFREYKQDESGQCPWLPEASMIAAPIMSPAPHSTYSVDVVTLDEDPLPHCHSPVVIKIDVEGFEVKVLRGAQRLLDKLRPHLAIDIHQDPFGDGVMTTEAGVIAALKGYRFEKRGHVLLALLS